MDLHLEGLVEVCATGYLTHSCHAQPRSAQQPACAVLAGNMAGTKEKKKGGKKKSSASDEPPLTAVERLQSLNLISRICTEWNNHLGISDRTLSEFVINLAEKRIKSFLKDQFVKDSGSLFNITLDGDDGGGKLRVNLISSSVEQDVATITSYRNDLVSNGAGSDIQTTFAARILKVVCDMSPRMERLMRKMNDKKKSKLKKNATGNGGSSSDGVMSTIQPSARRDQFGSQFPGLAGKNLTGSVPLEDGFCEHSKSDGLDAKVGDVHSRSRNKRRWDDDNLSKNNVVGETGKRAKSNLPAWMTKNDAKQTNSDSTSQLQLYQIYTGVVQRVLDFGVVVELNCPSPSGVPGDKVSGMVHLAHVSKNRIEKPRDANVRPGQRVYVKLISIGNRGVDGGAGEGGLMLSLKDVDQANGRDLMPHRSAAAGSLSSGVKKSINTAVESGSASASAAVVHPGLDVAALKRRQEEEEAENITTRQIQGMAASQSNITSGGGGVRRKKVLTEQELFEAQQLIRSGVLPVEQYPTFDQEGGLGMLSQETTEEETEVELADIEPSFLRGQTRRSGKDLEPVRIVKNPDGSLQRAAMQQGTLAKERRELRQAQANQLVDSIPKDLNRPWEDPLPEAGERHFAQELRSINMSAFDGAPEWKQKAESKTLSYGIISNKSIKEQRESLPVFRLKSELMRAMSENQVLVVIGETGSG